MTRSHRDADLEHGPVGDRNQVAESQKYEYRYPGSGVHSDIFMYCYPVYRYLREGQTHSPFEAYTKSILYEAHGLSMIRSMTRVDVRTYTVGVLLYSILLVLDRFQNDLD